MEKQPKLVFAVNGERFELTTFDPSVTVLEFLRTCTRYKGAKLGCGEGGCGSCVVLLSKYDPILDHVEDFSISSCLTLLISINGCSVTTTEGLGNSKDGFHSIHQRFSGFHASQCGFCTPGMCMSLFSALIKSEKTEGPEPSPGFSKLIVKQAERVISGNLCRCTGYRPIVDVCKSFSYDVDMEDLGLNSFWEKGDKTDGLPFYSHKSICTFPEFMKVEIRSPHFRTTKLDLAWRWCSPVSVRVLYDLLKFDQENGNKVKLVAGNTGSGIYKEICSFSRYINLNQIPELLVINKSSLGLEIGAAVSISKAICVLREEENLIYTKIADHMSKVASEFVRNIATLGGNLVMSQKNKFPSDIATILLAAGSSVNIYSNAGRIILTLEDFMTRPSNDYPTILQSILIPHICTNGKLSPESSSMLFETYRAAPRPLGNAVAYINAAFLAKISKHDLTGEYVMEDMRLTFGAYGARHAIRMRKIEDFLIGKPITAGVLLEGFRLLKASVTPEEGTRHPRYRKSVAVGFLFDFLCPFIRDSGVRASQTFDAATSCHGSFSQGVSQPKDEDAKSSHMTSSPLLVSSKQVVEFGKQYLPVGLPSKKLSAEHQASGEAIYVDDIPSPRGCLHGAFVYSTQPYAHVKSIEFEPLVSRKIVEVIYSESIPEGGENIGSKSIFGAERLFADKLTQCAGQPLAFVLAETQRYADMAAAHAKVTYDTHGLKPPILTVDEAVERSSFFSTPTFLTPKPVGDFLKGMANADHKITSEIKLGSQYYFYLETQTALAVPDEDNCVVVYSSTQCPENAQSVIAKCLGIPVHNVRVITRRVGGGFGGKAMRALPVATACALAAYKMCCPVRTYLDRQTDMIMAGGRHPMKVGYIVGFRSDGTITALYVDILINAGISEDISPMMPMNVVGALKKYNWGALSFDIKVCKTNHPSKSAMRGPGEVQGSFIAESIIEHVASTLSVEADYIRWMNIHTFQSLQSFYECCAGEQEYTLPLIMDKLAKSSNFHLRMHMIKHFNSCNKWKKRGISRIPIVHEVMLRPTPAKVSILSDGSIVVEVGGVELGQGIWTKVRQMTAFALGQLWEDARQCLLDRVRVVQADTLSLVQGGFTAGSTTSESSCEAVRISCKTLIERLKPLKDKLQEEKHDLCWEYLILQANQQAVNLSASTLWVPEVGSMQYLNYGAAVSEVEIDLLTGATTVLRTDIVYDCGQSLNPAVDLGQVEGAFVQGLGFFLLEEYLSNSDGLVTTEGTWSYKIPTVDTIPRQFNIELFNSGHHQKHVLSSKASGEPPLLLAVSVHCAIRDAIKGARNEYFSGDCSEGQLVFQLEVPATMPVVKELCGLDNVERWLESSFSYMRPCTNVVVVSL